MKGDDIVRLAKEAGISDWDITYNLHRFADLVRRQAIKVYESAPPECKTDAEKRAYAFGFFKAMEMAKQPANDYLILNPAMAKVLRGAVHASDISQEPVDETAKDRHDWGLVTDDALIEEVRRRGFTIRDAQISPKREWADLTQEEIDECYAETQDEFQFSQLLAYKLREKNA